MYDVLGFVHQPALLVGMVFLLQCHGGAKGSAMERSTMGPSHHLPVRN